LDRTDTLEKVLQNVPTKKIIFLDIKGKRITAEDLKRVCDKYNQEYWLASCNLQYLGQLKSVLNNYKFVYNFTVIPIDFDTSPNRYLDPKFLVKKERLVLKHDLWALESSTNLKKYHRLFEEKLKFLRQAGPKVHTKAIKEWWERGINGLTKETP
jgi:hypothetical protein